MTRRALKVTLGIGVALGLMAALAVGATAWLVSTRAGARLVLERAGQALPGRLEVAGVEGTLRSPLRLAGVVYTRNGMRLEIDRLLLRWRLRELMRRLVDVVELTATGVRIETTAGEPSAAPFELPQLELPLHVIVRQASVRDATVVVAGRAPIRIRSADLVTSTRGESVVIESFAVDSPDVGLEVSGSLTPLGPYAVDLDVAWVFHAPDGGRYRGAGTLSGTLRELEVLQRLAEPFTASVEARLLDPLDDLRFEGRLEAAAIDVARFDATWPAAVVSADLAASGSLELLEVHGAVSLRSPEFGRIDADLAVQGGGERWRIERLRLRSERVQGSLTVSGGVVLGDPPRFDFDADWQGLRWPLESSAAQATMLAPTGSVRVEGTLERYRLEGRARVGVPALGALVEAGGEPTPLWIDAEVSAEGDRAGARVERVAAALLGGQLEGEGLVTWDPGVEWRIAVRGEGLRPGLLDPRLEGELELVFDTEGAMTDAGPRAVLALSDARGTLRGWPVHASARVDLVAGEYRVSSLHAKWADAALDAEGVVADTLDLRFRLAVSELGQLLPRLAGSLAVEGAVTGMRASPRLAATASGRSLAFGDMRAASIAGAVDVGSGLRGPIELSLTGEALGYGERSLGNGSVSASGTRERHAIQVALDGGAPPLRRVALAGEGGLLEDRWRGTLERFELGLDDPEEWSLASPVALDAAADHVEIEELCLHSAGQRVCASGALRSAEDWAVEASASGVSLARFARFYREDLVLEGSVDATLVAEAAGGAVRGLAVVSSKEGSFVVPGESGAAGRRLFRDATLRIVADGGTRANVEVELVDVGALEGAIELPRWSAVGMPGPEQPLRGRLVAHAESLEPLLLMSSAFASPRGRLQADFEIAGTVGEPRLRGSARLTGGSAFVLPIGVTVEDVELTAEPNAAGELVIEGTLRSGDGVLGIRGMAALDARETLARLVFSGRDVLVMDLPDRRVVASTDELTLVWTVQGIEVLGDIRIPEAYIGLETNDPAIVRPSPDVVFVRVPPGAARDAADAIDFRARVRLLLGEEVRVAGLGLDAGVEGALLVVEEPSRPTRATGELDLAGGTFEAYGARLQIDRGRLVFADSPVTSPAVDLRASRRAGDVIAGIEVQGRLEQPRVTLWSEPPLPQAEQLSYLVLGRPLGEVGQQEGDLLTGAASSLGLRGGRYLAERLGSRFGLEEARIETGEGGVDEAALVLGKLLSPRLYVAYGVGLFQDDVNSLLLRYLLSDKLTLEALTGERTRADLLYVIELGPGEARPRLAPSLERGGGDTRGDRRVQ